MAAFTLNLQRTANSDEPNPTGLSTNSIFLCISSNSLVWC